MTPMSMDDAGRPCWILYEAKASRNVFAAAYEACPGFPTIPEIDESMMKKSKSVLDRQSWRFHAPCTFGFTTAT